MTSQYPGFISKPETVRAFLFFSVKWNVQSSEGPWRSTLMVPYPCDLSVDIQFPQISSQTVMSLL